MVESLRNLVMERVVLNQEFEEGTESLRFRVDFVSGEGVDVRRKKVEVC